MVAIGIPGRPHECYQNATDSIMVFILLLQVSIFLKKLNYQSDNLSNQQVIQFQKTKTKNLVKNPKRNLPIQIFFVHSSG